MKNPTINRPDLESQNYSNEVVQFAVLLPAVAELIGSIRWDAASILNWRLRSSAFIAHQILMRMGGEFSPLELRHGDLARQLRPELSFDAGARWVSGLVIKWQEDQTLSGFEMVSIDTGRTVKCDDGSFRGLPTLYRPGDFLLLYRAVQDAATECRLSDLLVNQRRVKQRSIIRQWLLKRGCEPIKREKKQKSKSATASEAAGADSRVDELRRKPNEDFETDLEWFVERYYQSLIECKKVDNRFRDVVKHTFHALEIAETRAMELLEYVDRPELRLVGGQPK